MEINEKLEHLTETQIEEVVTMYMDKSIKISDILSKYNIDVKPGGLLKILPPVRTNDVCVICGEFLYKNIEARTAYSYSGEQSDRFCLNCGHKEYANNGWRRKKCDCNGCKAIEMMEYERKKKEIRKTYETENDRIDFAELILADQVKLIYLLFNNSFHNTSQIAPMEVKENWIEYINRMVEIKAISVSPESEVEAFCEDDFPNKYYVDKVHYDVNVIIDEATLHKINKNTYFLECSEDEELITLFKEYIYNDLIIKFEEMLEARRLQLHISENANNRFIELIDKISYTQILALCNRVAVFFSDKVLIGDMTKSVAKNAALLNVSKFYDRAVESEWTLNHAEIDYVGRELNFFIEKVLNKDITILKDVASVENLKNWSKREIDYSKRIGYAED